MMTRMLILNGLAVVFVGIHHATAYGFQAVFVWPTPELGTSPEEYLGSPTYYASLIIRQLDSFAIPAFLFVSAVFIAFSASGGQSMLRWDKLLGRIKYLVLPSLVWVAIRFILLRRMPASVQDVIGTYYYVTLIFQFYLLSPLIVALAKRHWRSLLAAAIVVHLGWQGSRYLVDLGVESSALELVIKLTPIWFFPSRLLWFTLGVLVGVHRARLLPWLSRARWSMLAVVVALGVLTVVEYQLTAALVGKAWLGPNFWGLARTLLGPTVILCFLAFTQAALPFSRALTWLGGRSLGVYLANVPAIYVVSVILYREAPWVVNNLVLYQVILAVTALAIPLLFMTVVAKSPARRVYRFIFG